MCPTKMNSDLDGNLMMRRANRRSKDVSKPPVLQLEKVLGMSMLTGRSLAIHPNQDTLAYIGGCTAILYDWKRHCQGPFLVGKPECNGSLDPNIPSIIPNTNGISNITTNNTPTLHVNQIMPKPLAALAFSPDGMVLAVGEVGHNPRVLVWDLSTQKFIAELSGHKFGIQALAFSPNSKLLVSLGYQHDGVLNVWNWRAKERIATNRLTAKVHGISFSSCGTHFVTAGQRHVKFWYLKDGSSHGGNGVKLQILEGRSAVLDQFRSCTFLDIWFSTNGDKVCYTITSSGMLCGVEPTRRIVRYVDLKATTALSLGLGGEVLGCGCVDGTVRLFQTGTLKYLTTLPKPHRLGVDVAKIKTAKGDVKQEPIKIAYPDCVGLNIDSKGTRCICIYSDRSIYVWDITDLTKIKKVRSLLFHSDAVWTTQFFRTGNRLATCSSDGTARIWELDPKSNLSKSTITKELEKIIYLESDCMTRYQHLGPQPNERRDAPGPKGGMTPLNNTGVRSIKLTADDRYLISGDRAGNLRVHDLDSFEQVTYQEAHDAEIMDLDVLTLVSDDTTTYCIASASRDRLIHVFSMAHKTFRLVQTIDDHSSSITAVKFFSDGSRLISCGADKSVIFRSSLDRLGLPYYTPYHNYCGRATLYGLDGDHRTATATVVAQDKKVHQFDIASGKLLRSFRPETTDDIAMSRVALDASGQFACVGGPDKQVRLIDLNTGQMVGSGAGHSEMITSIAFSPDCSRIVSTAGDGCIFVWKINPALVDQMRNVRASFLHSLATKCPPSSPKLTTQLSPTRPRANSIDQSLTSRKGHSMRWAQKVGYSGISILTKPQVQAAVDLDVPDQVFTAGNSVRSPLSPLSKFQQLDQSEDNEKVEEEEEDEVDDIVDSYYTSSKPLSDQFLVSSHEQTTLHPTSGSDNDDEDPRISIHVNRTPTPEDVVPDDQRLELDLSQPFSDTDSTVSSHRRSLSSKFITLSALRLAKLNRITSTGSSTDNTISNYSSMSNSPRSVRKSRSSLALKSNSKDSSSILTPSPNIGLINKVGIRHLLLAPTNPRPLSSNTPLTAPLPMENAPSITRKKTGLTLSRTLSDYPLTPKDETKGFCISPSTYSNPNDTILIKESNSLEKEPVYSKPNDTIPIKELDLLANELEMIHNNVKLILEKYHHHIDQSTTAVTDDKVKHQILSIYTDLKGFLQPTQSNNNNNNDNNSNNNSKENDLNIDSNIKELLNKYSQLLIKEVKDKLN